MESRPIFERTATGAARVHVPRRSPAKDGSPWRSIPIPRLRVALTNIPEATTLAVLMFGGLCLLLLKYRLALAIVMFAGVAVFIPCFLTDCWKRSAKDQPVHWPERAFFKACYTLCLAGFLLPEHQSAQRMVYAATTVLLFIVPGLLAVYEKQIGPLDDSEPPTKPWPFVVSLITLGGFAVWTVWLIFRQGQPVSPDLTDHQLVVAGLGGADLMLLMAAGFWGNPPPQRD